MTRASACTMNAARPMIRSEARPRAAGRVWVIVGGSLSGNALREKDDVSVGIFNPEFTHAVELILRFHHHRRARSDRAPHRIDARGRRISLQDDVQRVRSA